MEDCMFLLYAYTAFLAVVFSIMLYLSLGRYKEEQYEPWLKPNVLVIVPCKGPDMTLDDNLRSLKAQDYNKYDIVAVVDDWKDLAVPHIKKAGIRSILSGGGIGSGKVNAIATAIEKYRGYDLYVIADSDCLMGNDWLRRLIAPLKDKEVGLATAFPYFMPRGGFWSRVKLVWGFAGQGMMESRVLRFGWGGSLAFRRGLLNGNSLKSFRSSLSDDIAITRIVKDRGEKIAYVKEAQPIVYSNDDRKTFLEWSNRQTSLSVMGDKTVFYSGITFYLAVIMLNLSALAMAITYSYLYLAFLLPLVLGTVKNGMRLKSRCNDFVLINTIMPVVFLMNLVAAARMKRIIWRGQQYELKQSAG